MPDTTAHETDQAYARKATAKRMAAEAMGLVTFRVERYEPESGKYTPTNDPVQDTAKEAWGIVDQRSLRVSERVAMWKGSKRVRIAHRNER